MNFVHAGESTTESVVQTQEVVDNRPLFQRLKEQKDKKQYEYDEAHKLKNQFRGVDGDEVGFLDLVSKARAEEEMRKRKEEIELINQTKIITLPSTSVETQPVLNKMKKSTTPHPTSAISKQASLVSSIVRKRKSSNAEDGLVKSKQPEESKTPNESPPPKKPIICALPGIIGYSSDDSSENSDEGNGDSKEDIES